MKKQGLPIYVLSAAILISAALVSWSLLSQPNTPPPPTALSAERDDYRLGKLSEVNDMVLAREIIPEDYLRYLPEDIREPILLYNTDTASLHQNYTNYSKGVADSHFYEHKESPGDYDQSALYYEWVGRISHFALYRNAQELCQNDPFLAYPLAKESGGSYGLWAYKIHESWGTGEGRARQAKNYFTMIDELLDKLDAARAVLTTPTEKD